MIDTFQPSPVFALFGRLKSPPLQDFQLPDPIIEGGAQPAETQAPASGLADHAAISALGESLSRQDGAMALFEFNYQAAHGISTIQNGSGITRTEFWAQSYGMKFTVAGEPEAAQALFDKLQSEFTPEKVADRIAAFATAGFGRMTGADGQDTLTDRGAFRDFIQKFVEKGFADALGMLGPLADPVRAGLDRTLSLVKGKLDAWVKTGDQGAVTTSEAVTPN